MERAAVNSTPTAVFPLIGLFLILTTKSRYMHDATKNEKRDTVDPELAKKDMDIFSSIKNVLMRRNVVVLSVIRACYALTNTVFNTLFAV